MKTNKFLAAGLAVTLLASPLFSNPSSAWAKEAITITQAAKVNALTEKQAIKLAAYYAKAASYIQTGGNYKNSPYKTFKYKGKTYRYLARDLDTKKELFTLLKKSLTQKEAEKWIKNHGIISYKGKMAQVEADGGSLLNWRKATAEFLKTDKNKTDFFRLVVPVGDTGETEAFIVEFQKVGKEYRISKVPYMDKVNALTRTQVERLAQSLAATQSLIMRGGDYKEGEYKSFTYKGSAYRYLAKDIDTKSELFTLLKRTLTQKEAEIFFKQSGIIEYKGKLAQPEADGGSLLQWNKAQAEYIKTSKKVEFYRIVVPVGDSGIKEVYIVELTKVGNQWRISKVPYLDLDIPGNINPAFQFFNHLLINSDVSKEQLLNVNLNVDEFKKGISKLEIREMKEIARDKVQVEFAVKFYVELESDYKGSLNRGENQMFFLIQQTNEMEYKIVSVGTAPHLIK